MMFGEKMAEIKKSLMYFLKIRSFQELLEFYFTVQDLKNLSNNKYSRLDGQDLGGVIILTRDSYCPRQTALQSPPCPAEALLLTPVSAASHLE